MQLYHFSGEVLFGEPATKRMRVFVTDLETGKKYKPVITYTNKMFNHFFNNRKTNFNNSSNGFYFTAKIQFNYGSESLRSINVYSDDEFMNNFAELLI